MATEHLSDTSSVSKHPEVVFMVLFDDANPNGLEVTKKSIETQIDIEPILFECAVPQLDELRASVKDEQVVIILRSGDAFYSQTSCKELIENITDKVQCVYSDSIVINEGDELPQLMFPFSLDSISSGYMITNVTLSGKAFRNLNINASLNFLLGHDIICKTFQSARVRHLAEVKFLLPSRAVDVNKELAFIGAAS